jgi:hypothetical protein
MELQIEPEPTDDERRAIVAALGAGAGAAPPAYSSRWLAAGLDELRGHALAEEPGGDPGVVEP